MYLKSSIFKFRGLKFRSYTTATNTKRGVNVKVVDVKDFAQNIESLDLKYKPLTKQILEDKQLESEVPWYRRNWFKKRSVGEYEFIRLPKSDGMLFPRIR